MSTRATLSAYKYRRLALESLRNSLRLLRDAIALHGMGSFPTAFQLAVLSMEEYAKAKWIDHVYYTSITNKGLPSDPKDEQGWLRLLYLHEKKQAAFLWREQFDFSPKLLKACEDGSLDRRKQAATYVGLPKRGKAVDVNARISLPASVREPEARRMISLVAKEVRDVYRLIDGNGAYFGIEALDEVIVSHEAMCVFKWPHISGLKSRRFANATLKRPAGS